MNIQVVQKYIQDSEVISEADKAKYLERLAVSDIDVTEVEKILGELEDSVQEKIDAVYDEAGVVVDESDPEYKKQHSEMLTKIDEAEREFSDSMEEIEKESADIQDDASQKLDDIKMQSIRDSINV